MARPLKRNKPALTLVDSAATQLDQIRIANIPPKEMLREVIHSSREGSRREVITLDEGDAVIIFPSNLSSASLEDFKSYLELFMKKIQRRADSLK